MSCHEQGSNAADGVWPGDEGSASGVNAGFLQVIAPEFTRAEIQALMKKAKDILKYGDAPADSAKREALEELVNDLDFLDMMTAREEADLAELQETIEEHTVPAGVTIDPPPLTPYPCPGLPLVISVDGKPINLGDC